MAVHHHALIVHLMLQRNLRRERVFRDREHPLDMYDEMDFLARYRFRKCDVIAITDDVQEDIELVNRGEHTTVPSLQVCVTLRFYATGAFQQLIGDSIGNSQSTCSKIIAQVYIYFHWLWLCYE